MSSDTYFTQAHRQSVTGASSSLAFPPLYLDPNQSHYSDAPEPVGLPMLGSTYYHHPDLQRLVSHFLADAPPPYRGSDDADSEEATVLAASSVIPEPRIANEFIALNQDLVPAPLDMDGETLPSEQHPSYPFGNLFGPKDGMLSADSAIMGSRSGRVEGLPLSGQLDLASGLGGSNASGRRGAVPNSWNSSTNRSSRTKIIGPGGASPENDDDKAEAAKALGISNSLLFRTYSTIVLSPPTWPFKRVGPGPTGYSALLRPCSNIHGDGPASQAVAATLGGLPASAKILREVWTDLNMEELVPQHLGDSDPHRAFSQDDDMDNPHAFAKRIATLHPSPLDLLGPISNEITGQPQDDEQDPTGWETAKHIWMQEERDRVLPLLASRPGGKQVAYQIQGHRANNGLVHRPGWMWGDEFQDEDSDDDDDDE